MQANKFFLGLFVCASLYACSDDDSGVIQNDTPKVFTSDEAYINVSISDAGSLTRGTTTDPGYEYGIASEHAVKNAYFYFYDANRQYVAQGSAWNGGTESTGAATNIEFKGNNVVVLKGLKDKGYPKYMVTVLNGTSTFKYGNTLEEMEKALSGGIYTKIDDTNYFIMSTTSFKHEAADNLAGKYFVTEVKESDFRTEPIPDDYEETTEESVKVYVERLAAKVTLDVDLSNETKTIEGKTYYKIKASVAGLGNDDDANAGNTNQTAAEDLLVHLYGWKLNATANNSYMMKNINEEWTDADLGFAWNKPADFRSFWGKSFNYGKGDYPTSAGDLYDDEELVQNEYLTYVNLKTDLTELGESAYCAENTNTSDIVTNNFPSAVTSILLEAGVCNMDGEPLDLIRFNGLLFTQKTFPQYILNVMNAKGDLNVWYDSTPDETDGTKKQYKQIDENYVTLVHVVDGEANVQLKETGNPDLYIRTTKTVEGKDVPEFTKMNDSDLANVNTRMAAESGDAIGYKGGLMYYNIPIEHLNNSVVVDNQIPEAKYGVVRNHHYVVTVNKLESVGHGIFDPDEDEVIVPGGGPEDKTYYVGTNINILSWKIVNQNVDL